MFCWYFSWNYYSFNFSCLANYYKNSLNMFRETGVKWCVFSCKTMHNAIWNLNLRRNSLRLLQTSCKTLYMTAVQFSVFTLLGVRWAYYVVDQNCRVEPCRPHVTSPSVSLAYRSIMIFLGHFFSPHDHHKRERYIEVAYGCVRNMLVQVGQIQSITWKFI